MKKKRKTTKQKAPEQKTKEVKIELSYEELINEKKAIEDLLASLEDEYREASISEEAYLELKEKNLKRLKEVEKLLKKFEKKGNEIVEAPLVKIKEEIPKKEVSKEEIEKIVSPLAEKIAGKLFSEKIEEITKSFTTELEKLKVLITTVKDGLSTSNERLQLLGEQLAEVRTLSHQREAKVRDFEIKLEKLSDIVSGLELKKLSQEFSKRDKTLSEHLMRIERIEKVLDTFREEQKKVKEVLEEIGSLENVLRVLKEVDAKLKVIGKKGENIEKISDKVEKLYIDLSKRLEEFSTYKEEQVKLKDLTKELMKSLDELNAKIAGYAKKEEIESIRDMLERRIESLKKETEELTPEPIKELRREKAAIEEILATLEKQYEEGTISEEEYKKAKEKNLAKLEIIEEKIKRTWEEIKGVKKKIKEKPKEKKEVDLIAELEDLFKKGMISKEAYERSRKILLSGK